MWGLQKEKVRKMELEKVAEALLNLEKSYIEGECVVTIHVKQGKALLLGVEKVADQPKQ